MSIKFFAISDLVNRLSKVADTNRYDLVSRTIHEIFEKKASRNPNEVVSSIDLKNIYSTVFNLNPDSRFKDAFEDIFPSDKMEITFDQGSPFRMAGYEEDFRPTPVEVVKSSEDIIKDSSFESIHKVVSSSNVTNPQYKFNQLVRIASVGKNSGVALWTVSFNTRKGLATIEVPVGFVENQVVFPKVFYVPNNKNPFPLTESHITEYASSFNPAFKPVTTEESGVTQIGLSSFIGENQNIKEAEFIEQEDISIGDFTPVDDSLVATVSVGENKIFDIIESARKFAERKLSTKKDGGRVSGANLQLVYTGASKLDGNEIDPSEENIEGVFAFNVSKSTRNGQKTVTIPVKFSDNNFEANSFYTSTGQAELNNDSLLQYFSNEDQKAANEMALEPEDAFTESFIASEQRLKQILGELKDSAFKNDFKRSASLLRIVEKNYGEKALKKASEEYINFVGEASKQREETEDKYMSDVFLL